MTTISIEALPVATGVAIGLAAWRLAPRRLAALLAAVAALPAGCAITYLAGELELSWSFLVFDVGQVVLAALLTGVAAEERWRRLPARGRTRGVD